MSSSNQSETLILPNRECLKVEKKDDGNVYRNEKHSDGFRKTINNMHIHNLLCDVTLVADHTEEIRAHKVVLAASSHFFYRMFSSIFEKSDERIVLDGVHRFALVPIIEYVYTGKIFITEYNVDRLLRAAHRLLVVDVVNACVHFMQTHLTAENCFNFAALAKEHECVDLVSKTEAFMTEHFCEIVRTETFLDLSNEKLTEIIKNDKLKVSNEIEVFNAVVCWVKHMIEIRQQYLASLMEYVRFPLMSLEDLMEKVEREPLVTDNTKCCSYIREAMGYYLMKGNKKSAFTSPRTRPRVLTDLSEATTSTGANTKHSVQTKKTVVVNNEGKNVVLPSNFLMQGNKKSTFSSPRKRPRVLTDLSEATTSTDTNIKHSVQTKKMLVVVGMKGRKVLMEKYDFEDERWSQGSEMFKRPFRYGSVLLNTGGKIYMIGGNESCKVDVFDLKHGKWSEFNDLLEDRDVAAAAFLDGDIYVSGGRWPPIKSCEKLDHQTGRWVRIADMMEGRYGHGMCAMDGKIYAVGGHNSTYLSSVEYYNPVTNSWTRVPDMSIRRCIPGVAGLDGKLYVVGGLSRNRNLKCVEVFNSVDQKWTRLADLNVARQSAGVVAANGLIYVAGGSNQINCLNSVEVYDPRIGTWTMLTNKMGGDKGRANAAVIDWPS